ncbi:MAG: hypothetical protein M3Y59_16045 [Myxococcota bacterium]|nr:hypothetical protein [Myxococcota bacterium]
MFVPLLTLVLATAPPLDAPTKEVKLAFPDFALVDVRPELGRFFSEHLAQELTAEGLRVITTREISTLVGLERQRALLGCAGEGQDQSCLVELANALGVDAVLLADLAKFEGFFQLNTKVLSTVDGRVLATQSARPRTNEQLLEELTRIAKNFASTLRPNRAAPAPALVPSATTPAPTSRPIPTVTWASLAVGAGLGVVGGVLSWQAGEAHTSLSGSSQTFTARQAADRAAFGQTMQISSWVAFGGGAAALASGALFWLLAPPPSAPRVQLDLGPTSAVVALGWELP